jgi:FkbM family methyltransferase
MDEFEEDPVKTIHLFGKSFKVGFKKYAAFWEQLESKGWEPETFAVFNRYLKPNMTFVDVGAWIGPTALYASQTVRQTIAFEPDPIAFQELRRNTARTFGKDHEHKVVLYNAAAAPNDGKVKLGSNGKGGDSLSSMINPDPEKSWTVEALELNDVLQNHVSKEDEIFCKVDIEGFEYSLVPNFGPLLSRENTWFYISLHPQFLWNQIKNKPGLSNGLFGRYTFFKKHYWLIRSLSHFQLKYTNGKSFNKRKELVKAFFLGSFPNGILAVPKG